MFSSPMKYAFVTLAVYLPIALMMAYFIYQCVRRLDRRVRIAGMLGFLVSLFWIMLVQFFPKAFDEHDILQTLMLATWPNSFGLMAIDGGGSRLVLAMALTILTGMNILVYIFVGWVTCVVVPWMFRRDRPEKAMPT
jgi:polyferredoxin